jgi:Domain of unknown function (DUF4881)
MRTMNKASAVLLICLPLLLTVACSNNNFGKVEQGRVIALDKQSGTATLIRDSSQGGNKPKYDVLPPIQVKIPTDPEAMGPLPNVGKRLQLDSANRKIIFFDVKASAIKTVNYTPMSEASEVTREDPRVAGKKFPIVDREKKTITIYSGREKKLVTFTVPDEYFALPDDTWNAGDDVRYYYKDPSQAVRMMNVTKVDIMKGK